MFRTGGYADLDEETSGQGASPSRGPPASPANSSPEHHHSKQLPRSTSSGIRMDSISLDSPRHLSSGLAGHSGRHAGGPGNGLAELQFAGREASALQRSWHGVRSWLVDRRFRTTVMVNIASVLERTDEQLLPAVYRFVGQSFGANPEQLGTITLARALVQAVASPLGGILGHYLNRVWVVSLGCTIWGAVTAAFSTTHSVTTGAGFWALNGVGLALVIPNVQSITADYYESEVRGRAFGALMLTGAVGGMLGALYATNIASHRPFGIEGWRFAFITIAAAGFTVAALNLLLARDPRCRGNRQLWLEGPAGAAREEQEVSLRAVWREVKKVITVPSFLIIILQGILGSTPWNALVFLTLYLQLLGMSDFAASCLLALFLGGTALGALLGGWLGDVAARWSPRHGRIAVCQASVLAGVPLSALLLKGLPFSGSTDHVLLYACVLGLMGLVISWAAPACNNPIFAEIVPPRSRNLIYAFDRSFEGAIAATAAPFVGMLAVKAFGFKGAAAKAGQIGQDLENARALGNALLCFMVVPWGLCFIFYSGLHYTYPRDKAAAEAEALASAQRGQLMPRGEGLELQHIQEDAVELPATVLLSNMPRSDDPEAGGGSAIAAASHGSKGKSLGSLRGVSEEAGLRLLAPESPAASAFTLETPDSQAAGGEPGTPSSGGTTPRRRSPRRQHHGTATTAFERHLAAAQEGEPASLRVVELRGSPGGSPRRRSPRSGTPVSER